MKEKDNIEKIFKETFEHFEAEVSSQVWSNIQNGIQPVTGSHGARASKFTIGKIALGAISIAIITGSFWYFISSRENSNGVVAEKQAQAILQPGSAVEDLKNVTQNTTPENPPIKVSDNPENSSDALSNSSSPPMHSINHYSPDHTQQIKSQEEFSSNKSLAEGHAIENADNTPSQSVPHKYGKGSEGPSSLIRGSLKQAPQPASSRKNISENNHEAEQMPSANIWVSAESGDVPFSVNFSNQGTPSSLSWNFGDGSTSKENNPSHTFEKPGKYVVLLTSKNSFGSSTDKITIEVKSISDIEQAPNVFSPNGDGENDLFFLTLKNISSVEVIISDLSAHIVGGWNTVDGSWNGKLKNGEDAPEGLYFYTIQAIGADDIHYSRKGSISLSRKR